MKRITVFAGHYGSGKTNLAVNYAVKLKKDGIDVAIADLDIVNPYFRTKDSEKLLKSEGIDLISLPFANSNVDLPALPSEVYGLLQRLDRNVIIDLGGDERGALAMGRFTPYIVKEDNYDMFFVVNFYRPLTKNAQEALEAFREIEAASGLKFTGIINNSNLGADTTAEDILSTDKKAKELCAMTNLPLIFTSVDEKFKSIDADKKFVLKLQEKLF